MLIAFLTEEWLSYWTIHVFLIYIYLHMYDFTYISTYVCRYIQYVSGSCSVCFSFGFFIFSPFFSPCDSQRFRWHWGTGGKLQYGADKAHRDTPPPHTHTHTHSLHHHPHPTNPNHLVMIYWPAVQKLGCCWKRKSVSRVLAVFDLLDGRPIRRPVHEIHVLICNLGIYEFFSP